MSDPDAMKFTLVKDIYFIKVIQYELKLELPLLNKHVYMQKRK